MPEGTHAPAEILAFWFYGAGGDDLNSDAYIGRMMETTWPGLGYDYELKKGEVENQPGWNIYDACEEFLPDMQAAAKMRMGYTQDDDHSVLSRIILLDQMYALLARARGEDFPFLTEELLETCDDMARAEAVRRIEDSDPADNVPLAHLMFLVSPLMRSESLQDHAAAKRFVGEHAKEHSGKKSFKSLVESMQEHEKVLRKFKRFPHRNKSCARKSTPEEEAWLKGEEYRPTWAEEMKVWKPIPRTLSRMGSSASSYMDPTITSAAKAVGGGDSDDDKGTPKKGTKK